MGRGAKKLPGSQALGLPGEQKAGHHEPLHAGEVSESEEDTDRGGFRINHLQEDKVLLPTSNGRPGVKLKKGVPGGCSRIPLTNAQRNRRKQPKQGDVAVASALQMSATIRRQLLQVCHQAGLSPPPLQVHSPEASEVPGSPVELDEPKLLRRSRPALAAQLRRATLVRAERERQRRSRAVQTVQSMPEVSIKMNQDAPLIPKSVELEGYVCQPAARCRNASQHSESSGHEASRGQIDCLDDIVVGSPEVEPLGDEGGQEVIEVDSAILAQEAWLEANVQPVQQPVPRSVPHEPRRMQVEWREKDAGFHHFDLEISKANWDPKPCASVWENAVNQHPERSTHSVPFQSKTWFPTASRTSSSAVEENGRRAGHRDDSYDVTVLQALYRKAGWRTHDVTSLQSPVESLEGWESPKGQEGGDSSEHQSVLDEELLGTHPDRVANLEQPPPPPPAVPPQTVDASDNQVSDGLAPSDRSPSTLPEESFKHLTLEGFSDDSGEAEEAMPSSHPSSSSSRREALEELPPLPSYRPLPIEPGSTASSRSAAKELEEQFYSSLQILDSVHDHLSQAELLAQRRSLQEEHKAEFESRFAGICGGLRKSFFCEWVVLSRTHAYRASFAIYIYEMMGPALVNSRIGPTCS